MKLKKKIIIMFIRFIEVFFFFIIIITNIKEESLDSMNIGCLTFKYLNIFN